MPHDESRPKGAAHETPAKKSETDSTARTDILGDLDALAESLRAYFVIQVEIDDAGHRRTNLYRSAAAAERAVKRARERGRAVHCTLGQILPIGVIAGLSGGPHDLH